MGRFGWWTLINGVLCGGTWGVLGWVLWDPGLQPTQDALGGWMIGLAVIPAVIAAVSLLTVGEWTGGGGGGGSWSGGDGGAGLGGGCGGGCGGCGGGL
ncbi:hypothetical protein AB0P15_27105 [Streptomyces sp. NPDC087917]|uniref:hypothetical protein n=1 Tax=Streptomyces sp. NPDC087917 TaxID=3155060 RepID=UPI00344453AC